ncbi:hypothetical protein C354_00891 [Cryptococcus neoformans MW-RSA1955]|nr:hypothetical protein C354_00891 [Cryptococcus neoformans var. grubii MW-RSA1955]
MPEAVVMFVVMEKEVMGKDE